MSYRPHKSTLAACMQVKYRRVSRRFACTSHRRRSRTTGLLERLNRELKPRTRMATVSPNEASLLFVTAVLMEVSEKWEDRQTLPDFRNRVSSPTLSEALLQKKREGVF